MANYHPQRSTALLQHTGPCGVRKPCWRAECRERFPGYLSVEVLPDRRMLAYCHPEAYPAGDLLRRLIA